MRFLMKKFWVTLSILIVLAAGALLISAGISAGFQKRSDVHIADFSVSEDGSVITIKTALSSSMGYIRAIETERVNDEVHCSFYNCFGGLNFGFGSKNCFEIPVDDSCAGIYFDRGSEGESLVLERDPATNE